MKRCHNCGRELVSTNKRFCQYCGASAHPTSAGVVPQTGWQPTPAARPTRRPRVGLLIAGSATLVVAAIVVALIIRGQTGSTQGTAIASGTDTTTATTTLANAGQWNLPPWGTTTDESTPDFSSSDEPTTTTTDASDPSTVVTNFYAAINAHDYQTAWQLGGQNLGSSYTAFADGFATTVSDDMTIVDASGDTVTVDLVAHLSDGTSHDYQGSYTVADGQIISGTMRPTS